MTLREILRSIEAFDGEATIIVAEPWTPESRAQVIETPDSGLITDIDRDGMAYFLEVDEARAFKAEWPPEQGEEAFCRRLILYAINDA